MTHDARFDIAGAVLATLFIVIFTAYGIAHLYAGWIRIDHRIGPFWATASVVVVLLFRFSLPITVGAFFGALEVWGWPWWGAALFAAPGLAFMLLMIPGAMASSLANLRRS